MTLVGWALVIGAVLGAVRVWVGWRRWRRVRVEDLDAAMLQRVVERYNKEHVGED